MGSLWIYVLLLGRVDGNNRTLIRKPAELAISILIVGADPKILRLSIASGEHCWFATADGLQFSQHEVHEVPFYIK